MRLNGLASVVFHTHAHTERGETELASAFKRASECGFLCSRGGETVLASAFKHTSECGFLCSRGGKPC